MRALPWLRLGMRIALNVRLEWGLRAPNMRQRPVGIRTRILAVIGLLLGLWQIGSWLQGAPIARGIGGLLIVIISGYWLFTRDKSQ